MKHKVSEIEELIKIKDELSAGAKFFSDLETKISSLEKQISELENSLEKTNEKF